MAPDGWGARFVPTNVVFTAGRVVEDGPLRKTVEYRGALAWMIGDFFLPNRLSWQKIKDTLTLIKTEGIMDSLDVLRAMGLDAILVMLTGGMVLAIPTGLLTYVLVFRFFAKVRQKRREKHLLNRRDS